MSKDVYDAFEEGDIMEQDEPRMDGTPLQQAMWRIEALREALALILSVTEPPDTAYYTAESALAADDGNRNRAASMRAVTRKAAAHGVTGQSPPRTRSL